MKKISVLALAAALGCGGALAATTHDTGSSASHSAHALASDVKGALHKLGDATRNLFHRADASLHRGREHKA